MPLFRRDLGRTVPAPGGGTDPDDPAAVRATLVALTRLVNTSAGRLPTEATVLARELLDVLAEILEEGPLDPEVTVAVRSTADDYLPTSLRSYLSVDEALADTRRADGRTPHESLVEQLVDLEDSAARMLTAVRERDADAVMTQGSFLRTKFSRSDLEL